MNTKYCSASHAMARQPMKTALGLACLLAAMSLEGAKASEKAAGPAACTVTHEGDQMVKLGNGLVALRFDLKQKSFSLTDERNGEVLLDNAWMSPNNWVDRKNWEIAVSDEAVADVQGKGRRIVFELNKPKDPVQPTYLFSYTLHEGQRAVEMGMGLRNTRNYALRLMMADMISGAQWLPGRKLQNAQTLNGSAGSEKARVEEGANRKSLNSLMITALAEGQRRTVVWGGLRYSEFARRAEVKDGVLSVGADDPVGRLVDPGQTWWGTDTCYLDATTADPFAALEQYGRAMRAANNARPNVHDFPVTCGWSVHHVSRLPTIDTSKLLIDDLEAANRCGMTKYTKVSLRLEPCNSSISATADFDVPGWFNDEHYRMAGFLVPPYETMAKWCKAMTERNGIPYTYIQTGMPATDYSLSHPDHMLGKDISRLPARRKHNQPTAPFDYTSKSFQDHMLATYRRLKDEGIRGLKFDYPETAWRPEGGFENKYATTAFAYRETFRLAREGMGEDVFLDERNIGENLRPCLDVTAGLVDTQRVWTDCNRFVPGMVTITGLRWYKNRTVFNYYQDTKTMHDCTPDFRRSTITMVALTSGRMDLATSYAYFTPEIVRDLSRMFPEYREPFTARPLDAFCGPKDPQRYDLELTPDWHQVALFNTSEKPGVVDLPLSGDRVTTGAIGLDPAATYYVYDFWRDELVGKVPGTATVKRELGPSLCAMLSVRKAQGNPQVLSTSRHILQGWVDLADVKWDAASKTLSGVAKVIGGEPFKIVLAGNGLTAKKPSAQGGEARLESHPAGADYSVLVLERPENGDVAWKMQYK